MLIIPYWVCFYVKNSSYAQIYASFMILLILSQILFWFSKLVHLLPIYVLLLTYMLNLSIIKFLEFPSLFLPKMTRQVRPFARHIWPEALENSKSDFTWYIRPSHRTYLATWTYPAPQLDISSTRAAGYIKGGFIPLSNPNSFTSSTLHPLRLLGAL
jgi:hypothetical protein